MTNVMLVKNTLKDYNIWRPLFEGNKTNQADFGIHIRSVYQAKEDPNTVFIVAEVNDIEQAQALMKQVLESGLQEKAGVINSEPTMCIDVT